MLRVAPRRALCPASSWPSLAPLVLCRSSTFAQLRPCWSLSSFFLDAPSCACRVSSLPPSPSPLHAPAPIYASDELDHSVVCAASTVTRGPVDSNMKDSNKSDGEARPPSASKDDSATNGSDAAPRDSSAHKSPRKRRKVNHGTHHIFPRPPGAAGPWWALWLALAYPAATSLRSLARSPRFLARASER